jgi:hypothetical protein
MPLTYIRHKSGDTDHLLGSRMRPYSNASVAAKGNKKRARFYLTGNKVAGRGFEVTGLPASRWSKNSGHIAAGAKKKNNSWFTEMLQAKEAGMSSFVYSVSGKRYVIDTLQNGLKYYKRSSVPVESRY